MKRVIKLTTALLLCILLILSATGCRNNTDKKQDTTAASVETNQQTGLWANALYLEDTELGTGAKVVKLRVEADKQAVTFTIRTDKGTVGAALKEHNLIDGEESSMGLMVKSVNGITADYNIDQSYWAFYIDGDYAMSGVDSTEIKEGVTYRLVYTK